MSMTASNTCKYSYVSVIILSMQVLNNIITVVDQLLDKSTTELLESPEIQQKSASRILKALENFVKAVDSISSNRTNNTFDLKNLTTELPNVSINFQYQQRLVCTSCVFCCNTERGSRFGQHNHRQQTRRNYFRIITCYQNTERYIYQKPWNFVFILLYGAILIFN